MRKIFILIISTSLLFIYCSTAYAEDKKNILRIDVVTDERSNLNEYSDAIKNKNIQLVDQNINLSFIRNFSISNDGKIAVCYGETDGALSIRDGICVYDNNGTFLYGFTYKDAGLSYVAWIENYPAIVSVRSSTAYLVDEYGDVKDVVKFSEYASLDDIKQDSINFNGYVYVAKKNTIGLENRYSSIVRIDSEGNEKEIIKIGENHKISQILITGFAYLTCFASAGAFAYFVYIIVKSRKTKK